MNIRDFLNRDFTYATLGGKTIKGVEKVVEKDSGYNLYIEVRVDNKWVRRIIQIELINIAGILVEVRKFRLLGNTYEKMQVRWDCSKINE